METKYQELIYSSSLLSKFMREHRELFGGKSYAPSTISTLASQCRIPARQMLLKGKINIEKAIDGRYSFDVSEIIRWCQLGADRAACIQVLREREL